MTAGFSISTGAYVYPFAEAARIALTTARDYLRAHPEIALVRFVLFGQAAYQAYEAVGQRTPSRSFLKMAPPPWKPCSGAASRL
jgi:O-acetyl-ADP-ribose deacetylase (regulator of RNase III)